MKSRLLIEQHFHGAYGVDFNKASVDDVLDLAHRIIKEGIGGIFPTLVTDKIPNIKRQVEIIKLAAQRQKSDSARILGVHLEGVFINPEKKGIHNTEHFLSPTIENFEKIADEFIRIVTLAPELCRDTHLIEFLNKKGIKVQAGHCVGSNLTGCSGVTHLFNAMSGVNHRQKSTALSALLDDNLYCEIIADGIHVNDDAMKLLFKSKPIDKIILISDSLPCAHSNIKEFIFADEKIYFDGEKAASANGTLAGSSKLLPDIIKILASKGLFNPQLIENPYKYHNIKFKGSIEWDEGWNIIKVNY